MEESQNLEGKRLKASCRRDTLFCAFAPRSPHWTEEKKKKENRETGSRVFLQF